jgi:GNAT superfamily N-acetyltransferase
MGISVKKAVSRRDMRQFVRFPFSLYAGDPQFVPPLLSERKRFFSHANPLFEFTEVDYLLAHNNRGKLVGRITAHVNRRHNDYWHERTGFFGFLECVPDVEVARALLSSAEERLRQKGMTLIRGPFNFSTNEECGFLIKGFDTSPVIMMPHTKPYYPDFMSQLGYVKAKDLLAYSYSHKGYIPDYLQRFSERVAERSNVTVRPVSLDRFEEDVAKAFSVYNQAWARNWGFVPMTEAEFTYMAHELRPVVDTSLAHVAEIDGEPVGFALGLPDYNPIFRKMNGRLFPFGIFRFLLGRRHISRLRVITMGVVPEHRKRGIDIFLIYRTFVDGLEKGYRWAEFSWVLEDNEIFKRAMDRLGAEQYKTYRIYEKPIADTQG